MRSGRPRATIEHHDAARVTAPEALPIISSESPATAKEGLLEFTLIVVSKPAWHATRNAKAVKHTWQIRTMDARSKLRRLYPPVIA